MIEYKQNYPILLEEFKQTKGENKKLIAEKETFEKDSKVLLDKFTDKMEEMSKEEIIEQFRAHVLNFLYKWVLTQS